MIRNKGKFLAALFIINMIVSLINPWVYGESEIIGSIPVQISLTGTPPKIEESYNILMKGNSEDFPMPKGSQNGVYTLTIKGEGKGHFPEIEFSSIGIYSYTIWQEKGSNELGKYDDTIYSLLVYVTNSEDGEGLTATVLLYKDGETTKYDEVEFENHYKGETIVEKPEKPKPIKPDKIDDLPKTGADSNTIYFVLGALLLAIGVRFLIKRK